MVIETLRRRGRTALLCLLAAIGTPGLDPVPAAAGDRQPAATAATAAPSSRLVTLGAPRPNPAAPVLFDVSRSRHGSTSALPGPGGDLTWSAHCDADRTTALPFCTEPTGYYEVHGTIEHARQELQPDFSPVHPKAPQYAYTRVDYVGAVPAREVLVRVSDGCGLYTDTYTDAVGRYSVVFPSWCGEKEATVTLYSISAPGPGRQVALGVHTASPDPDSLGDLVDDPSLYTVVSGEVGSFVPEGGAEAPGGVQLDRTFWASDEGRLYDLGKFSRKGEVARALTVMENTMTALDYYRQLVDPDRLPQINLVLTDQPLEGTDNTAAFSKSNSNRIYVPPRMEWSQWAVIHETGHYFDGGVLVEGGLGNYGRWGEPMANVRAGAILGTPWMTPAEDLPSENLDVQGNWDDGEGAVVVDNVSDTAPGQGWTWRILWDLHDGGAGVAEPIDFGHGQFDQWDGGGSSASPLAHGINGVVRDYLPQRDGSVHPDYVDRGQSGPDLVDMLDGFACLYGLSILDMESLLHDVMQYGYDFGHCSEPDNEAPGP